MKRLMSILFMGMVLGAVLSSEVQAAIRVAGVGANDGEAAAEHIFAEGDLEGTFTRVSAATFNAMSVAQLRENFDVLIFTWISTSSINADWTTRLLPYLALGGGILFEDPGNMSDLAPGVTAFAHDTSGAFTVTPVPGLTDGIDNTFVNNHMRFTAWDSRLSPFLRLGTHVVGLYGQFPGCGRIVLTGPDQHFHAHEGMAGGGDNQYNLLINELVWVTSCERAVTIDIRSSSLNPRSKGVVPVVIFSTSVADGDETDFDAAEVDPLSVAFGPGGAAEAHGKGHIEDVDGDGDLDLMLHFRMQESGIRCGHTEAELTGETYDGERIAGVDTFRTVGCK